MKKIIIALVLTLLVAPSFSADFYTWQDENGKLHVTDKPPEDLNKDDVLVKEYSYSDHENDQPSETFQHRVYNQIDAVNEHRYQDATQVDAVQRKKEKQRLEKTIDVEKKMLKERIHYYKFRCAEINSPKKRKTYCDGQQKLYEKKLDLLNRDPKEYFMRETRY
ncbi:DUF4124 domain-containing protein [uncultured Desulfuromonas sp.]|uniref:DUF4124 domain-containing protein n=1 Tax=uncultured Desulfuromonas sp. TaxID=181013 RepID=UPI002AAB391A|nr:DUF4124 domain-containing protein [uncultured Desulfuromonas sp.]